MKTKLLLTTLFTFVFYLLSSQVPQGFNYQAIARDASGNPIINTPIPVRITIQSDSLGGTTCWIEEHSSVTTNGFGLFTLILGKGIRQSGSTVATFNDIDWKVTPKYIKTEIYYQTAWKNMGSTRFWSVPYSVVSGGLSGSLNKLTVKMDVVSTDSTLFEVRNNTGQTIFAVYNEGVRVYVDDGVAKGTKGGFAIGGFGSKATSQEYLRVTRDSTRVYVNTLAKGAKGGFAIGGFNNLKATTAFYLNMTPENYFIGEGSGEKNLTGLHNSFFGYYSGYKNTDGLNNVFIGNLAGYNNTSGSRNTYLGNKAGYSYWNGGTGDRNVFIGDSTGYTNYNGYDNVFMGSQVGPGNTTGHSNVFMGFRAGYSNQNGFSNVFLGKEAGYNAVVGYDNVYIGYRTGYTGHGQYNVYIGHEAGLNNAGGSLNTFVGKSAGRSNINGSYNVFLGLETGWSNQSGTYNVYLGYEAGFNNISGTRNVFLGPEAGYSETGSNRLYIDNSATSAPLIYGEFDNRRLVINGNASSNLNSRTFFVYGDAGGRYSWFNDSDERLKHDITTIPDALHKVLELRGVNYFWNDPSEGMEGKQMGFIGQEAADVVPEIVSIKNDHYSMQYAPVTALLVEALKEQQKQIESTKEENKQLKSQLQILQEKVNQIEAMLAKGGVK